MNLHADENWAIKHTIILKAIVCIGIVASTFLPAEHAWAASLIANMVWLWKL